MKKTVKLIAVMLVLAMTLVMVPAFTVSAEDAPANNVVLVGAGQEYELISAAITGLGANIVGKTIKLTSDIEEPSSIKFDLSAITDAVEIDGDGHTMTLKSAFIAIDCKLTLKNIDFKQTAVGHPIVYARGNSDVIVENCTTLDGFAYCFGLNAAGNCHITVNSGYYQASQKLFNLDIYGNTAKTENTVTINGGTFVSGGNIAGISAKTTLDINGGTFVTTTNAAFFVDTKNSLKKTTADGVDTYENLTKVTVSGATFIAPSTTLGILAKNADATKIDTVDMAADNTNKLYAVLPASTVGTNYMGSISNGEFPTIAETTAVANQAVVVTTLENPIATAYLENGTAFDVNAEFLPIMNNPAFNYTYISLKADTDITLDLNNVVVAILKNGKNAPNLTSTNAMSFVIDAFTKNFSEVDPYMLKKDNADGTTTLRVVVAISSLAYSKAGVVYTKGADASVLKYNNLGKYAEGVAAVETTDAYTSLIAGGDTYEAAMLGGNYLVILDIAGLNAGETVTFKAYGITSAGAEYTNVGSYTVA